jgi:hypothetical protein
MTAPLCYVRFVQRALRGLVDHKKQSGADAPLSSSLWTLVEEAVIVLDHCAQKALFPRQTLPSPTADLSLMVSQPGTRSTA